MHFLALSALFLNAFAAPATSTCAIQRGKNGLTGTAFGGKSFVPGKTAVLLNQKLGDVSLTVASDFDSATGYPIKHFKVILSKGGETDTFEAYSDPSQVALVSISSLIKKGSTAGSSIAFSNQEGEFKQMVLGIPVEYSVVYGPNGGRIKFDVNKKVSITVNNYGGRPFYNMIEIQPAPNAKITGGQCKA